MVSRLKRVLGPVRPIFLPVWRPLRRRIRRSRGTGVWHTSSVPTTAPIRALGEREFAALVKRFPYYKARGRYTRVACRVADDLIARHGLQTALELGPYVRPIIIGADAMDKEAHAGLQVDGRLITHDARDTPWPIEDGRYDLFVALQVFEHLHDRQNAAFDEVRRVARHAIISLPIDWQLENTSDAHHGLTNERALSWFHPLAPTRIELGNSGNRKRLIYVFENLRPTGEDASAGPA